MIAWISSVLIDVDHLIDYFLQQRRWYGLKNFFDHFSSSLSKHYFLFHGWEWPLLLFGGWFRGIFPAWTMSLAIGMFWHLLCDQAAYHKKISRWYYFVTFRAIHGFDTTRIFRT